MTDVPEKKKPLMSLQPVVEKRGRPPKAELTREELDKFSIICADVSDGKTLKKVLARKSMPAHHTFYRWLSHYDEDGQLKQAYALAIMNKADTIVDEALDIADTGNGRDVRRATLRVNTRLDIASKLNPRKYSSKMLLGGDPKNPIEHQHALTKESAAAVMEAMRLKHGATGKNS